MTVRLKGEALSALRKACFERDEFTCQNCGHPVLWHLGHMAHKVSRGAGGSDTLENVRTLCPACHLIEEHNPKSVARLR